MARVMREATIAATAEKLFAACGPTWIEDSYNHWSAVVKGWSVGSTRPLHDDDRFAIFREIQALDGKLMAKRRDEDDEEE